MATPIYLCLLLSAVCFVSAEPDPSVCIPSPPSGGGPTLPKLPEQYRLRVEANINDKNFTLEMQEYYDEPGNRGAADTLFNGQEFHTSYNYKTGQSISTFGDKCFVGNMSTSPFNLYGFELVDGSPHIGGVNDLFVFGGKYNETYMGQETVRGIITNHWQNCMYVEGATVNQTYLLDYYFTLPGYKTAGGGNEVPVRAILNGTAQYPSSGQRNDSNVTSYYHVYEFFEVVPGPVTEERAFEPPLGYVCENRTSEQPFPDLSDADNFKIGIEISVPYLKMSYIMWEYYNYPANIVSFEYQPWDEKQMKPGPHKREVHDYNLGLSFNIDRDRGSCVIAPITRSFGDAGSTDGQHVYLRSIASFLQVNTVNWVYEGQSERRKIPVESWIAKVTDFELSSDTKINMTLEYFFANQSWVTEGQYWFNHFPIALDATYTLNDTIIAVVWENFFGLDLGGYDPSMVDISVCYDHDDSKELAIDMEDKYIYDDYVQNSSNVFYQGVINSLAKAANVTPSRVSSPLAVESSNGLMTIYFLLLGVPPYVGDAVNMTEQISLEKSYGALDSAINDGIMITFLRDGATIVLPVASKSLRADFYSTESSSGYSTVVFVSMGVGMFLSGGLLVSGIGCAVWRIKYKPARVPYSMQ